MISAWNKLAFVMLGASACLAAAPAQANTANTTSTAAAAAGTIDVSKVASPSQQGEDAQFQQLFARWESLDKPAAVAALPATTTISVPSRMPLEGARMSSDYGMRTHPVTGGRRAHKGIDLAAPTGTPIYATADGLVSRANRFGSYGNYVSIEHGAQLQTRYAHMSRIAVSDGQRVTKGQIIGFVGSTGRSTGPHLHYEVRIGGEAVNPVPYMVESQAQQAFALATGNGGRGGAE